MRVINRIVPALYAIKAEYMTNKVYCFAGRKVLLAGTEVML